MSSYSAYFVRSNDVEQITKLLGAPEGVADSPWFVAKYSPGASPPSDDVLWGRASLTQESSQQLGEVIYLFADTSTGGFVYEHAQDGKLLRKLVWFPLLDDDWTPGWLCAVGEREDWETALFRADQLSEVLEEERATYKDRGDADAFSARETEIKREWEQRSIQAGGTIPRCDASVAALVERQFGLKRPARTR